MRIDSSIGPRWREAAGFFFLVSVLCRSHTWWIGSDDWISPRCMSKCLQRQHTSWSEKSLRAPPSKIRAASCSSLQPPPSSKDYQRSTLFKDRQCYQVLYKNTTPDTSFISISAQAQDSRCMQTQVPANTHRTPHKMFSSQIFTWKQQPCHKLLLDAPFMSQLSKHPPHLHLGLQTWGCKTKSWIFFIWPETLQSLYTVLCESWFQAQECCEEIVENSLCVRHWNSFKPRVSWGKQRHDFGIC